MKMKPFKIKCEIVFFPKVDGIDVELRYVCDQEPNTVCGENPLCGECEMTKDIKRAKRFDIFE